MTDARSKHDEGITCPRCGRATGNTSQGHRWRFCRITRTHRRLHYCCPEPQGCEIEKER